MAITKQMGHTGLETRFGRPNDDFLEEWRGLEKVKRVTEMLKNSPVIGALRMAFEMPLRNVDWYYTSDLGEDDPRIELAEAARANLSHSWNDHIAAAMLAPFYGWSMFTLNYERINGRLLWSKFKELGQETVMEWVYDEDESLAGLRQLPWLSTEVIPIERMLIYRMRYNRGSPEGESILRPAWIPYYYVKNLQQVEAISIERNLNGLPVVTPPQGADMSESDSENSDYGRAVAMVRNIRNDEQAGIVKPPPTGPEPHNSWQVELLTSGGMSKVIDTDIVVARYEKRMLMVALAQFLILGQDKVGSLSLSTDQSSFFSVALNSIADIIAETHTKFALSRLMALNGYNADGLKLEHSKAGDTDTLTLADTLQKATPFLTWTTEDEIWLRSIMNMPDKSVEELEAEHEAEQERRTALLPTLPRSPVPGMVGDDEDGEQMRATVFGAAAPDDARRVADERKVERDLKRYFAETRQRVERAAKKLAKEMGR